MSETIYTGLGAIEDVVLDIDAGTLDLSGATFEVAAGTYTAPGGWRAPDNVVVTGSTAQAFMTVGPGHYNPPAGSYYAWYQISIGGKVIIRPVRSTRFTVTDVAGVDIGSAGASLILTEAQEYTDAAQAAAAIDATNKVAAEATARAAAVAGVTTTSIGAATTGALTTEATARTAGDALALAKASNLADVASTTGARQSLAVNPMELPAYITSTTRRWDPRTAMLGVGPVNNRTFATALGKAAAGTGVCHDVFIGDSSTEAFNGTAMKAPTSWPEYYRLGLLLHGVPTGGTGMLPFASPLGSSDSRITTTGTWSNFFGLFRYATTGATATFTLDAALSSVAGTFYLTYDNTSGHPAFTVKVGAASADTVTPTGAANTIGVYSKAGTFAGGTTVVITPGAGGNTVPYHLGFVGSTGYHKHNLARSSTGFTTAGSGSVFTSVGLNQGAWDPTTSGTNYGSIGQQSYSALSLAGITAHRVTVCLGANDLTNSVTPTAITTGLTHILSQSVLTGATVRIVVPWQYSSISNANWEAFAAALWAYCDTNGYQLLDWRHLLGNYAAMQASGVLGADNAHTTEGAWSNLGRHLAITDLAAA